MRKIELRAVTDGFRVYVDDEQTNIGISKSVFELSKNFPGVSVKEEVLAMIPQALNGTDLTEFERDKIARLYSEVLD